MNTNLNPSDQPSGVILSQDVYSENIFVFSVLFTSEHLIYSPRVIFALISSHNWIRRVNWRFRCVCGLWEGSGGVWRNGAENKLVPGFAPTDPPITLRNPFHKISISLASGQIKLITCRVTLTRNVFVSRSPPMLPLNVVVALFFYCLADER